MRAGRKVRFVTVLLLVIVAAEGLATHSTSSSDAGRGSEIVISSDSNGYLKIDLNDSLSATSDTTVDLVTLKNRFAVDFTSVSANITDDTNTAPNLSVNSSSVPGSLLENGQDAIEGDIECSVTGSETVTLNVDLDGVGDNGIVIHRKVSVSCS